MWLLLDLLTALCAALAAVLLMRGLDLDPAQRRWRSYRKLLDGGSAVDGMSLDSLRHASGVRGIRAALWHDVVTSLRTTKRDELVLMLAKAGSERSPEEFRARRWVLSLAGAAIGFGVGSVTADLIPTIALAGLGAWTGFLVPKAGMKAAMKRQEVEVGEALPEVITFLKICYCANQPLEQAVETVAAIGDGPVMSTLKRVNRRWKMGWKLDAAFEAAAEEQGCEAASDLYLMLSEGVKNSGNVMDMLTAQLETLRAIQASQFEDLLARRENKMLLPFICFILPPMLLLAGFLVFTGLQTIV